MVELGEKTHSKIMQFCAAGDQFALHHHYQDAIAEYGKALSLVPEPKSEWEASTWIFAAMADAFFLDHKYSKSKSAAESAIACPGGLGNPFLHLRLGQAHYEEGSFDKAADELMRAYMGDGLRVFEGQDQKYLAFLRTRAKGI